MISLQSSSSKIEQPCIETTVRHGSRATGGDEDRLLVPYFERFGGIAGAEDLVSVARTTMDQPLSFVARRLVDRNILSFAVQSRVLVPRFQFVAAHSLTVSEPVAAVLDELKDAFEGNALASWFIRSNGRLGECTPCAILALRPDQVISAAREDRWVIRG